MTFPLAIMIFALPHGLVTFRVWENGLDKGMIITGDSYGRSIMRSDLIIGEARRIDLEVDTAYKPTTRTNGMGLPKYQSGWFNTQGAGKALVFASDWSRAVLIPTKLGYVLLITPETPDLFLGDLARPQFADTIYLLATPEGYTPGVPPGAFWMWGVLLGVPGAASLLVLWITFQSRRTMFELTSEGLRIRSGIYGRRIPWASLKLDEMKLVNIKSAPDRLDLLRINGAGMPGYHCGWHRNWKDKASYLLFVTDPTRVVRIPTRDGYTLLISPAASESFMSALSAERS